MGFKFLTTFFIFISLPIISTSQPDILSIPFFRNFSIHTDFDRSVKSFLKAYPKSKTASSKEEANALFTGNPNKERFSIIMKDSDESGFGIMYVQEITLNQKKVSVIKEKDNGIAVSFKNNHISKVEIRLVLGPLHYNALIQEITKSVKTFFSNPKILVNPKERKIEFIDSNNKFSLNISVAPNTEKNLSVQYKLNFINH